MRYVDARIQQEYRELAYRIYVTDSLQSIPQNKYLRSRFVDAMNKKQSDDDNKTGEQLVQEIIERCGLIIEDEQNECI